MENKKMTKREILNAAIAFISAREEAKVIVNGVAVDIKEPFVAYANNEIANLDKKASKAANYQSKTQKDNEALKATIVEILGKQDTAKTVSELIKENAELASFSNQKISALLSQLVSVGEVEKTVDKKKSYFSLAEADEDEDDIDGEDADTADETD